MLLIIFCIVCFFQFRYIFKINDYDIRSKLNMLLIIQIVVYLISTLLINLIYYMVNNLSNGFFVT
ncbi:hypothetical protein [Thomasclavelia cocleata]|uniref:hypothetical protein n=1 Tax=Thomasclavelia cocleata TaxID=69824 RepID=UPI002590F31F|nr:hypothetical protein [Thomasclavelia cocleata]